MRRYLIVLLVGAFAIPAIAADVAAPDASTKPAFQGIWTIREVQVLIVADKDVLQVEGHGSDAPPQASEQKSKELRPLLAELNTANTMAKLVDSLREELAKVNVKVTDVTILSASGSSLKRQDVALSQELLPRASALLVVVPDMQLSADYRTLVVSYNEWVCRPGSNDAAEVGSSSIHPAPLDGVDPIAQWSADHGLRFFKELDDQEANLAKSVAAVFTHGDPRKNE